MSGPRPSTRQAVGGLVAAIVVACAPCTGAAVAAPALHTDHGCYLVGQAVRLTGAGFSPNRAFDLADDGVDFGQSATDSSGTFSVSFRPGGLPAGVAQHVSHLNASDGSSSANATITITRSAGARVLAAGGNPHTLKAPFEVWGFALDGHRRRVYLHYVSPSGHTRLTVALGRITGQCGYLLTRTRRVFPFSPSIGNWILQLDTRPSYSQTPGGPVARIGLRIS